MIYFAIETDKPTLELVRTALSEAATSFDDMAVDADHEENRHPDKSRLRLGDDGLHVRGERQVTYRGNAARLRDFLMQLL